MFEIVDGIIRISVRNLVEFIYRSGDLDNRFGSGVDTKAMLAGAKIHRKIQKQMGSYYKAEVMLTNTHDTGKGYEIVVEGRADGILTKDDEVTIDEIKSMYADVSKISKPEYVHLAQAMCYAYFYALDNGLDKINVWITYVNIDSEDINRLEYSYSFEELSEWYEKTMNKLEFWTDFIQDSKEERNKSIENIRFPFEYREGQKDLCVSVYKTISRNKVLFIQAPTGVGKTVSTIFPAVMALSKGHGDKIFYLTAKTITRTVAENTYDELRKQNLKIRTIILTAKDKICPHNTQCNPVDCPFADGHYDRVNGAVSDIIEHEYKIDREKIMEYAVKHNVCPFEFSLDISYWCDGITCDYNYVFDPNVYLRRFFSEENKGNYIFLIDEAHNLVERGREMYSASISKQDVMDFINLVKNYDSKLYNQAERINKSLLAIKRMVDKDYLVLESAGTVTVQLNNIYDEILRFMEEHKQFADKDLVLDFFFKVRDFISISELVDENYIIYARLSNQGDLILKEFCVNPSDNLNMCLRKGRSAVFFSATFLPINYYKNLLRGYDDDYAVYAKSPFNSDNRKVLIASDVTTKYSDRSSRQYDRVYNYINTAVNVKKGNYIVFFPSYSYMQEVYSRYNAGDFECILQTNDMDEAQREEFLEQFGAMHYDKSLVGFCVMGGIFSEGIDLKEESLIGAIVVGTGLPQTGVERTLLMERFSKEGKGFEYAYVYPGLNKVLQSAGRVIRTDKDRGIILLLDNRFLSGQYDGMMPAEWTKMEISDINSVERQLEEFWKV